MRSLASLLLLVATALPALADNAPYAGLQQRAVKSLSEEEIAALRTGQGAGMALPAELNRYPGPRHVLDLAAPLNLTEAQRNRSQALFEQMKAEAVPAGEKVIAAEARIEHMFAQRHATPERLAALLDEAGAARAALRLVHLKYHIAMADLLSPEQIARYASLRGYDAPRPGSHGQDPSGGHAGHGKH